MSQTSYKRKGGSVYVEVEPMSTGAEAVLKSRARPPERPWNAAERSGKTLFVSNLCSEHTRLSRLSLFSCPARFAETWGSSLKFRKSNITTILLRSPRPLPDPFDTRSMSPAARDLTHRLEWFLFSGNSSRWSHDGATSSSGPIRCCTWVQNASARTRWQAPPANMMIKHFSTESGSQGPVEWQ